MVGKNLALKTHQIFVPPMRSKPSTAHLFFSEPDTLISKKVTILLNKSYSSQMPLIKKQKTKQCSQQHKKISQ